MVTRRDLLKMGAYGGAAGLLVGRDASGLAGMGPPSVPPISPPLTKYVNQLPVPAALSPSFNALSGFYELSLSMDNHTYSFDDYAPGGSPELGAAQTFGYGGAAYLGPTVIATRGQPIKATISNNLTFHPLATTLATPNPLNVMGVQAQDATAPRTSVHLHGGYNASASDGGPREFFPRNSAPFDTNTYTYTWANDQQAANLWYHDHALGLTRANVYCGLAAFYLLRDEFDTGAAGNALGLPAPYGTYEIPLVLQDKSFNADGTLYYSPTPAWIPEFFGDVSVVNGKVWPNFNVEQAVYRFRIINGSEARFYKLSLSKGGRIYQIGTDTGLLNAPVRMNSLLVAPGERVDILVDFTRFAVGDTIVLQNNAPTPFPTGKRTNRAGGVELPDLMQFTVTAPAGAGAVTTIPGTLRGGTGQPPLIEPLSAHTANIVRQRNLVLFEVAGPNGPVAVTINVLGFEESLSGPNGITNGSSGNNAAAKNTLEQWNIINMSADTHPMHIHLIQFQLLNRQHINTTQYLNVLNAGGVRTWNTPITQALGINITVPDTTNTAVPDPTPYLQGMPFAPASNELGWKDTIQIPPGQVTRLLVPFGSEALGAGVSGVPFGQLISAASQVPYNNSAEFGGAFTGPFVWHCHILDHEENDMMNDYDVA